MLRNLYTLFSYLIQPIVWLVMYYRERKQPGFASRWAERYAFYGSTVAPNAGGVLIHASSVGEVIAATRLIQAIQHQYPDLPITVTTFTATGSERVASIFGQTVFHCYLPYDLPDAMARFLTFIQPKLVVVIETELWPNLLHQIQRRQIPLVIANARLSARSATRYGWVKAQLQPMWQAVDLILAQDSISAERYLSLGVGQDKVISVGNLKFDLTVSEELRQQILETQAKLNLSTRPVWIAGSTHEGEEKIVLEAHQQLLKSYPDLLLILVPRHPQRFASVETLLQKMQMHYSKRSDFQPILQHTQVLFVDTMGEMMLLYGLAHIAFVGGSLIQRGGHNPLEPIAFQLPVISGRYTFNFPDIIAKLRKVKGVIEIDSSAAALRQAVSDLLTSPEQANLISQAGLAVLQENQGALQRHLDCLAPFLASKCCSAR